MKKQKTITYILSLSTKVKANLLESTIKIMYISLI